MALLERLADAYVGKSLPHPQLRSVTFAQWLLESGRATSRLAIDHFNFGGLKFRPEMASFATKILFDAHDGPDFYCKFGTIDLFLSGYWAFLNRSPYSGWESHADTPEDFIRFIGPIYTPTVGYSERVLALLPEARDLLDAAATRTNLVESDGGTDLGTIVIDPGHGGAQRVGGSSPNNAISVSGALEKNLALDFCTELRDLLVDQAREAGQKLKVVLTRTRDINVGIKDRAQVAAANRATAFLCWHFNGGVPTASGVETFFGAAANGNMNVAADTAFARAVHAGLLSGLRAVNPQTKDRGVKPDTESGPRSLGVLNDISLGNADRPRKCVAAYVEAEFISNPKVDKLLISGPDALANRTRVLAEVAKAIRAHLATLA